MSIVSFITVMGDKRLPKLKQCYHKHHSVYAQLSILKLIDRNDSSRHKCILTMKNNVFGSNNPDLTIFWLMKHLGKSSFVNTTGYFIINGSIVNDTDTIY